MMLTGSDEGVAWAVSNNYTKLRTEGCVQGERAKLFTGGYFS